jgi:hypothetical protein
LSASALSGDSVRIPRKLDARSGGKPNSIPG